MKFGFYNSNTRLTFASILHDSTGGRTAFKLILLTLVLSLTACSSENSSYAVIDFTVDNNSLEWVPGSFQPAANFQDKCASPRTGSSFTDTQGTTLDENNWLRSWSNDTYLWYDEIIDQNPALFDTLEYFDLLKTNAVTPSGTPKDKFHFALDTEAWEQLSQSGVSAGYGAQWAILSGSPPRQIVVAYTEPDSPATRAPANLVRGTEILAVNDINVDIASASQLNTALFPDLVGESHFFTVRFPDGTQSRFSMTSTSVTSDPVQNVSVIPAGSDSVGYMLFNDHIATAEEELGDAVRILAAANIDDLVLDIRYNGGGFLAIASQLAYMIAGDTATRGKYFEATRFNDKHLITDINDQPITPFPFIDTTIGLSAIPSGQPLPTLDLSRVFVLTGPGTCSASESIINGLRGINVDVIQIGSTTCGKPYGFYPADNCGTTYFTIQFKGENALGFGDYGDGFSPANTIGSMGTSIPGCSVRDDFSKALGDSTEQRLAAALNYRLTSNCPTPTATGERTISGLPTESNLSAIDGDTPKSPWLENRILSR